MHYNKDKVIPLCYPGAAERSEQDKRRQTPSCLITWRHEVASEGRGTPQSSPNNMAGDWSSPKLIGAFIIGLAVIDLYCSSFHMCCLKTWGTA
ncbi:hypothetical protein OPV22_017418 [Ensete ventricosum]|uniref:Uncharacterized protein n=1 Tax=Ensete ventricosum TaxID=4639 RepID=A0AAV8QX62_ENSVE|nr:hypothetical protein OPV22_017418 [Ensete ventricosum]